MACQPGKSARRQGNGANGTSSPRALRTLSRRPKRRHFSKGEQHREDRGPSRSPPACREPSGALIDPPATVRECPVTSPKTVSVNAEELRTTFEFVSFGAPLEHSAYICVDTGKIYCHSLSAGLEEEDLPEDLETSDNYIAVPRKNDLGLGRRLALAFVDQEVSDEYDTVARFFGRRGAYGRFKSLLHARGMVEQWYEFENRATEEALLAWCEENGIQPVDG